MSDENLVENNTNDVDDNGQDEEFVNDSNLDRNADSIEKLIQQRTEEALKDIKNKLDNAYNARDKALEKLAQMERDRKEAELKRMEEEGKHKEVLEHRLLEANAQLEVANKRITELTRDVEVREALSGLPFRNDKAAKIAYREIVDVLVQDEKGVWRHKSGVSIKEWVEAFTKDEDQSFLFKAKSSNGSGTGGITSTTTDSKTGSLFDKSQDEVLKMALEGKLPNRR